MNNEQLLRYSRQITLPEIDIEGQLKINSAKVLVIGLGALGTVASNYLCRAGVGTLGLCDFDNIDISNLPRQVLYKTSDVGKSKVKQACKELSLINPECYLVSIDKRINQGLLEGLIDDYDLIVDATDNFKSRYIINKSCFSKKTSLVSGSALGWCGQLILFDFLKNDCPCYECCFGYNNEEDLSCSQIGIMSPVAGIIGSLQALEAIKKITQLCSDQETILQNFDFLSGETKRILIKQDLGCRICGDDSMI